MLTTSPFHILHISVTTKQTYKILYIKLLIAYLLITKTTIKKLSFIEKTAIEILLICATKLHLWKSNWLIPQLKDMTYCKKLITIFHLKITKVNLQKKIRVSIIKIQTLLQRKNTIKHLQPQANRNMHNFI